MKYILKEYYCIYIDLLGYTNRVEETGKKYLNRELAYFIEYVGTENRFLIELSKTFRFHLKIFSDNIFIALPVENKTINDFHLILGHIIDYQKSLISHNYFLRGGITKGKLFVDENLIWGPAMIGAVKLEKFTKYPFINLSNKIVSLFIKKDLVSESRDFYGIPIIEIIKGKYFLDYLQTTLYKETVKAFYSDFLRQHKTILESNLNKNYEEKILSKYLILANYHNNFCKSNINEFPQMKRYLIKNFTIIDEKKYNRKYLRCLHSKQLK